MKMNDNTDTIMQVRKMHCTRNTLKMFYVIFNRALFLKVLINQSRFKRFHQSQNTKMKNLNALSENEPAIKMSYESIFCSTTNEGPSDFYGVEKKPHPNCRDELGVLSIVII